MFCRMQETIFTGLSDDLVAETLFHKFPCGAHHCFRAADHARKLFLCMSSPLVDIFSPLCYELMYKCRVVTCVISLWQLCCEAKALLLEW